MENGRVAIVTWFHYINYGTALQVFAEKNYIEKKGYLVEVVQYYPEIPPMYYKSKLNEYLARGKNKLYKLTHSRKIIDTYGQEVFQSFINENLPLTERVETAADFEALNDKFDCFVCGSDQIWSPLNFDPHYFLDFVTDPSKMIAYAPSLGVSQIDRPGDDKKIAELTNRFKYLSVREKTGAELIRKLNGREARVVLDPTFLLYKDDWDRLVPGEAEGQPYVLAYFLRENKKYWKAVNEVAKKLQLEIKVIPVFEDDLKMSGARTGAGPDDFVRLIRGASFICTDSFHGMAFAVNFNKQFLPFQRFASGAKDSQNSRVYDFLDSVGLKDRIYDGGRVDKYLKKIEYKPVNEKLEVLRRKSKEYLDGALEEITNYCNG